MAQHTLEIIAQYKLMFIYIETYLQLATIIHTLYTVGRWRHIEQWGTLRL